MKWDSISNSFDVLTIKSKASHDITMNWEIFPVDSICCRWGEVFLSELFYILNRGGGWNLDRVNYIHLPLCLIVICLNSTLPICNSQPSRCWQPLSPLPWSFGRFSISWEFKVHDIAISLKISPEIYHRHPRSDHQRQHSFKIVGKSRDFLARTNSNFVMSFVKIRTRCPLLLE